MTDGMKLTDLRMLEAESIHIMREVVAEFQRPVVEAAQFIDLDVSLFDKPEDAARAITEKLAERGITPEGR